MMRERSVLRLNNLPPLDPLNGGLFVSTGHGSHPTRTITSYELILLVSGRLHLFEGDRSFVVESGETLLLWPDRRHGGLEPYARDTRFYWVHFRCRPAARTGLRDPLSVPQYATLSRPERLAELFRRFLDDQETETLTRVEAALLIALMLSEVARGGAAGARHPESELAESVLKIIDTGYTEPISTSEIAGRLRYNPDYLGRTFREATGHSITETIGRRRIREARALLVRDRMTIREVAFACGFTDPGYFRRVFRRLCGMTPRQYRSLHDHVHINTH